MTDVVATYRLKFKNLASKGILGVAKSARVMAVGLKRGSLAFAGIASAAAAAGVALANSVAGRADEFGKLARQTDISADSLQQLSFIAERQGTDFKKVEGTIKTFTKRMGELRKGFGPLLKGLENINPELIAQFEATKSNEEAYKLLLNVISELPDAQSKAALGAAAVSKEGAAAIIRLTDGGAEGFKKLISEANKFRPPLSAQDIANAESFKDAQFNTTQVIASLGDKIGASLLPRLTQAGNAFNEFVASNREIINTKIDQFISRVSEFIGNIDFKSVADSARNFGTSIVTVTEGLGGLISTAKTVAVAVGGFLALGATSTLVTTLSAIVAVIGGPFTLAIGAAVAAGALLIANWDSLVGAAKRVAEGVASFFVGMSETIKSAFFGAFNFVIEKINSLISKLNNIPGISLDAITPFGGGGGNVTAGAAVAGGGGGGSLDINISGNVKGADVQANAVGTGIADSAGSNLPTFDNARFQ